MIQSAPESMRPRRSPSNRRLLTATALVAFGSAILLAAPLAGATGQDATGQVFFRGDKTEIGALSLSSWGSGNIKEDDRTSYDGGGSLRISTQGYYQGASIGFQTPLDMTSYATNKNAFLQLALLLPGAVNGQGFQGGGFPGGRGGFPGGKGGGAGFPGGPGGGRGGSSFPGGPGGGGGSSFPGGAGGQGFPGGGGSPGGTGFPGGAGGQGFPGASGRAGRGGNGGGMRMHGPVVLQNLRLVIVTTGGKELEMLAPVSYAVKDNQWRILSIPVPGIPGLAADDAKIKAIRLFGDAPATIYLGKISVIIDQTPLKIDPLQEQVVGAREGYLYTVHATGGATALKFSWDWDASDGIQDETQGRAVKHIYYKPGDYTVTVTALDAFDVKPPVTTTFKVHVHP